MTEKYYLLHSVYFYDKTTGRIYNSNAGSYDFDAFYDKEWLKETKNVYSVQQLPLRYSMDDEALYGRSDSFYKQYFLRDEKREKREAGNGLLSLPGI